MPRRPGKTDYASAFGQALDEQLSKRALRQADLARTLGTSPAYVNRLMMGAKVSPEWADLVADTLRVGAKERAKLHVAAAVSSGYKIPAKPEE